MQKVEAMGNRDMVIGFLLDAVASTIIVGETCVSGIETIIFLALRQQIVVHIKDHQLMCLRLDNAVIRASRLASRTLPS